MKFYIADCFAEEKYQGNQLAVMLPDREMATEEMQQIAREIGFSETAFILSGRKEDGSYDVRIFTPAIEVPFAGHPVLGTAYIIHSILEDGQSDCVRVNLKAGQISLRVKGEILTMTQNQPQFGEKLARKAVADALSLAEEDVRSDYPVQWTSTGLEAVIVPLNSLEALQRCRVDFTARQKFIDEYYSCNVLAFACGNEDLRVRVFMEEPGFPEDAATGSANGALAAYLLQHNFFGCNELEYVASQGIEMGRPSKLFVHAARQNDRYHIEVGGKVFIVAEGNWL